MRSRAHGVMWVCLCVFTPAVAEDTATVGDVLDQRERYQDDARQSQDRVAALDDAALAMLSDYHAELDRLADLEEYNANLRTMLTSQAAEKARLDAELKEIEVVKRALVPLMGEMIDVLERFLALDQPMLMQERSARLAAAKENMIRSDIDLAEKYRRLIEAYHIEAEYGQTIEAYEGPLSIDGRELTVDYLRVGRVALYYMTLDRDEAGIWDPRNGAWVKLANADLDDLDFALRVARKQAPPDLVPLPLWTPVGS
jgi:hypothetical protein